jgi:ankyrin repeat protein
LAAVDSEPPVAAAALQGFEDLIEKLLEAGGSKNITSHEYGSALAAAASAGNINIVKTLLAIDNDPAFHQQALERAASAGFQDIVTAILERSARLPCDQAFEIAAFCGHDEVIQQLWSYHKHYAVISGDAINNALYQATDMQQESTVNFSSRNVEPTPTPSVKNMATR